MVIIDSSYRLNNISNKECKNIKSLDINFELTWTNIKKLEQMKNLESFYISGYLSKKHILQIPPDDILDTLVKYCKNLQDILFYSFKFQQIPQNIHELKHLNKLSLINCSLKIIPSYISKLKLVRLELSNNLIKHIPSEIYNMTTLKSLQLDNNKILVINDKINKLVNLRSLSIQHNNLLYLSKNIYSMNLFELYVDYVDNDIVNMKNITGYRAFKSTVKYIIKNNIMVVLDDCLEIINLFNSQIKIIKFLNCDSQINFGIFPIVINKFPPFLEIIEMNLDMNFFIYKFNNLPQTIKSIKLNTMFYDSLYNDTIENHNSSYNHQYNEFIKTIDKIPYRCNIYLNNINEN